jgi:3-hydroxyacyl-CoA dehydrogenase/enoyl-CoA hydratase/carnithine racemase
MSDNSSVEISQNMDGIAVLNLRPNAAGSVVLTADVLSEIDRAMETLSQQDDVAGLVVKSAGRAGFAQSLDFDRVSENFDWPAKKVHHYCQRGRAVLARLSRCPFPTVALIENQCFGNGLELSLWCDYRVAASSGRVKFAFDEVKFGLMPGWAGTVLLPRVIGLDDAAELLTSGDAIGVEKARAIGLVDVVGDAINLQDAALALLQRVKVSEAFVQHRVSTAGPVPGVTPPTWQDIAQPVLDRCAKQIVANESVFPYAPTVLLEHLVRTCVMPAKEAWRSESKAVAQVWGSPASRGSMYYEAAVRRNRKSPGLVDLDYDVPEIKKVGIVGAGLMGSSIAKICVDAGLHVWIYDADVLIAENAVQAIQSQHENEELAGSGGAVKIDLASSYEAFGECDLVIESVVETIDVKKIVLQKIESAVKDSAIIASNTSAIPIEKLGGFLKSPNRFCGIHFCHPELMSLVEVICGPATAEQTVTSAVRFVQKIEKMPVAMNDSPGFVVNRLLAAMLGAALDLYSSGIEIVQIDSAIKEFGFLGGPFEIIDVIGVDTCMYAGRTMWESGLDCVALSPVLPKLMKNGRLGRKVQKGFYDYTGGSPIGTVSQQTEQLISGYREKNSASVDDDSIVKTILEDVAKEAKKILAEDMVADPMDIDLCIVNGFSFPRHRGGILFWDRNADRRKD